MNRKMKAAITLCLVFILALTTLFGCGGGGKKNYGQWYDKKNEKADQSYLFGICGGLWQGVNWYHIPWEESIELYNNLGVKSVRNWMHVNWLLKDKDTVNQKEADLVHAMLAKEKEYGMQIIGMNHSSFKPAGYVNSAVSTAKPARDLSDGSVYMQWLEDYEQSWFTLVSEFPEVEYWEIDNESNNETFMPKLDGGSFTNRQCAAIFTDMLFFASRGIHRANPNAITVMGGLIPSTAAGFFDMMYDFIFAEGSWSPYPDDYFQVAAWHPYDKSLNEKTIERWVSTQKNIYSVIKEREGKDKKVFFTEFGWSDISVNETLKLYAINAVVSRTKNDLPFVETMHYFSMFDNLASTWGSVDEKGFGLFNDPNNDHPSNPDYVRGAPKSAAILYQQLAGGTGDLTLIQQWSELNSK